MKQRVKMPEACNKFGVTVRKCCASCKYKEVTRAVTVRHCVKKDKDIEQPCVSVCSCWSMSDGLRMAGMACGRVKSREYLLYLASLREEEAKAEAQGMAVEHEDVETVRARFEQRYGTIYINI